MEQDTMNGIPENEPHLIEDLKDGPQININETFDSILDRVDETKEETKPVKSSLINKISLISNL